MIRSIDSKTKKFWKNQSKNLIWEKPFSQIYKFENILSQKWFIDGKINIYKNLIQKNQIDNGNKVGITCVNKDKKIVNYNYNEIHALVLSFEKIIQHLAFKKKINKIMIHSSASKESFVSMLACAKLGIEFSVLFENLESQAILNRINIFKPDIFISRLNKNKFLKKNIDSISSIKKKTKLFFFDDLNKLNLPKKIKKFENNYKTNIFDSNKSFFTLFTSGSTGQPKGICHNIGGYLTYSLYTSKYHFGMNSKSVILTASDAGWINGHTYALFSPLLLGAETILVEDPFLLLDEKFLHKIIKERKVSILYLPVTIIRIMRSMFNYRKNKNFFLKTIGSMGEHLAKDVGDWYSKYFKNRNKSIINTYFQTETGGILFSPKFNEKINKSPNGSVGSIVKNIHYDSLEIKQKKEILVKSPFPGLMKKVINSQKEHRKYFDKNGNFRLFDLATKIRNAVYVHGRIDDVINVRGHRIGCAELEKIILKIKNITECAAIGVSNKLEGKVFILFLVSKKPNLDMSINKEIISHFGSFAIPKKVYYLSEVPKTRSGKILRRLLRDLFEKKTRLGDLSTIKNKKIIEEIRVKINEN
tara:strand:- start:1576 stop:3336 length:1761 start_codon:yes stop_codon:yes gene_type:complete